MAQGFLVGARLAFQNAFFIWNKSKLEQLEDHMRKKDGMTVEQIEAERYYNCDLYKGCIDQFSPGANYLYWRVHSVSVMYGDLVDSNSDKPLFNTEAWTSAKNLLTEILRGYYSDPP